jgi:hypothetical protein
MGDDGSEWTEGYMQSGVIPNFKIYDAATDRYLDATPSEQFAWSNLGLNIIEILLAYDGSLSH